MLTDCDEYQSFGIKVSVAGDTVPSVGSPLERPITTSAVGSAVNSTEKVAVPDGSLVFPLIWPTKKPYRSRMKTSPPPFVPPLTRLDAWPLNAT